jgi:isoamylase
MAKIGTNHPLSGNFSITNKTKNINNPGAKFTNEKTITFKVFSKNASKVILEIYDEHLGKEALYDYEMQKDNNNFWTIELNINDSILSVLYGYRAWGNNWIFDSNWKRGNSSAGFINDCDIYGNRYNPNKLLIDPYAKEISHDAINNEAIKYGAVGEKYASGGMLYQSIPFREYDTGIFAPKSIIFRETPLSFTRNKLKSEDLIIYEVHIKGFTMNDLSIDKQYRGTYKGAALKAKYLKELGINAVEFLPIHECENDQNDIDLRNSYGDQYWGYMTTNYFSPDRRYSSNKNFGGPTQEFKEMVEIFHKEGIEVYLDVVYNHTGEGGLWFRDDYTIANVKSFRGLDNQTYYERANRYWYYDNTGCGANFNCGNDIVMNLITDSLLYWAANMGIDGFRLDLAPVIGNVKEGNIDTAETSYDRNGFCFDKERLSIIENFFNRNNIFIPDDLKLIVEPWAATDGFQADIYKSNRGFQLGHFPEKWMEWNGHYRDAVKRIINEEGNKPNNSEPSFCDAVYGTRTLFNNLKNGPITSINYITCHDGFTLFDYIKSTGLRYNLEFMNQIIKNSFVILMFSRGIPMVLGGDEFGRTQLGDYNPYAIDNNLMWYDYNSLKKNKNLFESIKRIISLRTKYGLLRTADYNKTRYYFTSPALLNVTDKDCMVAFTVEDKNDKFYVGLNMWKDDYSFHIPQSSKNKKWAILINTDSAFDKNYNFWPLEKDQNTINSNSYLIKKKSCVVLKEI